MTKRTNPSNPPISPPSPADVLANRAGALINNWKRRHVTVADFHAADDAIIEMYQYDEARATAAHIKLCEQYEAFLAYQTNSAQDEAPALQPALL